MNKNSNLPNVSKVLVTAKIIKKEIKNKDRLTTIKYFDLKTTFNDTNLYNKYSINSFLKLYLVKTTDYNGQEKQYLELTHHV